MKKLLLLLTALFALTAAAQDPVVTVTPSTTNMGKISAYNSSFTLTGTDGQTWKVAGFNNNNLGWATDPMRCGWKTSATSATITTNFAITEAVDKITFDVWRRNAGANDKLTAIKVLVSADASFSAPTEYAGDISEIPSGANGRGTVTVNITAPVANQYYRIMLQTEKATNNGWLGVNTISYFGQQDADAIAAPIITLEENNMVSITHEDGADIYYTTDGEVPTTSATQYTAPFAISDVTTVKAIAVLNGKESAVTTKEVKPNVVTSIGKFLELANNVDDTKINVTLTAIYQCGRNLYLTDGTDYILAYNSANLSALTNLAAVNGDAISFITGAYKSQNGLPEIIPSAVGEKSVGTAIEPNEYAIDEISASMLNEYVKIVGVNIVAASAANNYTATDENGNSIVIYNTFNNASYYPSAITLPDGTKGNTIPEGENFTVYGFVSCYNATLQITPIKFEGGTVMETVATPTFSPESGAELSVGDKITIECATEGATIYYTINGDTPTTESNVYTEPFAFAEACTVKAIAAKEGYIESEVASAEYALYIEGQSSVIFDFTTNGNVGSLASTELPSPSAETTAIEINGVSFTNGPVKITTLTANHSNETSPKWFYYGSRDVTECRIYKGNQLDVVVENGYKITKIEFTQNAGSTDWTNMTVTPEVGGTWTNETKTWTADADASVKAISFVPTGTNRFATMKITYIVDENAPAAVEYCQPTGVAGRYYPNNKTANADRVVNFITFTDGTNSVNVEGAPAPVGMTGTRAIVYDRTSTVLTTKAGSTINATVDGTGVWMNTFVYADFDLNGFTVADKVFANFDNACQNVGTSFSFNVPATAQPGDYRVRYILDWENTDPCFYGQAQTTDGINDNGEYVIDFIITVAEGTPAVAEYTVTINQPSEGGVITVSKGTDTVNTGDKVAEGTELTLAQQAAEGFSFVNFLVNGEVYEGTTLTVEADVTISATFEANAPTQEVEYCVPEHISGSNYTRETDSHDERYLSSIILNDTFSQMTVNVGGTKGGPNTIWNDFTATYNYVTNPGNTVDVQAIAGGEWMNTFVYIDFDNNGFTAADQVFTNYTGNHSTVATQFKLTIPETVPYGTYRVRYIVDWNNEDPCFWGQSANPRTQYGECVVDFLITLKSDDLDVARTVTVAANNDAYGTVAITDPATEEKSISTVQKAVTVKATPAEGFAFINWTNAAGEEVSTETTYVYTGTEDVTLTANFGYTLSYFVGEGGTAAFMVDGQAVNSDVVLAPETEVTVNVTPGTDLQANIIVNGQAVNFTNNTYTFVMNRATSVVVSFVDAVYTLTIEVEGDGEVKVTDAGDYKNGPSGNEYTNDSEITGLALKGFVKPAEGAQLVYIGYEDEGNDVTDLTSKVREVTAAGFEGWYFVALPKAKGNRVLTVEFTEAPGELEYCQPEPVAGRTASDGKTKRTDRYLSSINLSDGENTATVEGTGYSWNRDVYADRTSTAFSTTAGKTVAVSASGAGEWMNTYVFVDFDLNGFTAEDLVFSNYAGQEPAPDNTVEQTFSFDVPATVEPGDYRVRYILDWWNDNNPCVYGQAGSDNGEAVVDFIITVSDSTSGIGAIGIDPANGPVEYYNLQGVRVAAENLVPGFYVVRQGEKAAKVFINK